jgi:hypothetical protein
MGRLNRLHPLMRAAEIRESSSPTAELRVV